MCANWIWCRGRICQKVRVSSGAGPVCPHRWRRTLLSLLWPLLPPSPPLILGSGWVVVSPLRCAARRGGASGYKMRPNSGVTLEPVAVRPDMGRLEHKVASGGQMGVEANMHRWAQCFGWRTLLCWSNVNVTWQAHNRQSIDSFESLKTDK